MSCLHVDLHCFVGFECFEASIALDGLISGAACVRLEVQDRGKHRITFVAGHWRLGLLLGAATGPD